MRGRRHSTAAAVLAPPGAVLVAGAFDGYAAETFETDVAAYELQVCSNQIDPDNEQLSRSRSSRTSR